MTLRSRLVDGVFGALELAASLYGWVQKLRRPRSVDVTEPFPLEPGRRRQQGRPITGEVVIPRPPRPPRV